MLSWSTAPYIFIFWVGALYCGPAMGPLLAAYAVPTNWRWPLWEIVIIAAPSLIVMVCLLAETSHETILLHRAQRLRRINPHILAPSETRRHGFKNILVDALIKPVEILIKDPAIAYISAYTSLVYATYYSFFQALPIAFGRTYRMFAGSQRLMFLTIVVGCLLGSTIYAAYLKFIFYPRCQHRPPVQEDRLFAAIPATCFLSVGLFIFAWTARSDITGSYLQSALPSTLDLPSSCPRRF
ncbi:hypothetical protein ASPWEDRAFT_744930 [Aspergillus wentii DTO 134E9]|uniref:Major facilitator superfamily (MFS) profile domain-containing protein n=1 Tax=Aspergillus wentii DTO 134E9 TaxID=1073089 RepID=A0A1L9RF61_ASPWE|nr:uncharacterized protein ASPWEDRAFT_744930 [Aspergillus wentii DTO 134E9]OJJ33569.1 hypothetical protein ASPWEDRAFT_744930 [Aspergillus wentii DTO 134E9]